jgi:hypothetical protein
MNVADIDVLLRPAVIEPTDSNVEQVKAYLRRRGKTEPTAEDFVSAIFGLDAKGLIEWRKDPTPAQRDAYAKERAIEKGRILTERQNQETFNRQTQHQQASNDGTRLEPGEMLLQGIDTDASAAKSADEAKRAGIARAQNTAKAEAAKAIAEAEAKAKANTFALIANFSPTGRLGILFAMQKEWQGKMRGYLANAEKKNVCYTLDGKGTYTELAGFSWVKAEVWIASERLAEYRKIEKSQERS